MAAARLCVNLSSPSRRRRPWPGNVRELRNIVQRCAALATSAILDGEAVRAALVA